MNGFVLICNNCKQRGELTTDQTSGYIAGSLISINVEVDEEEPEFYTKAVIACSDCGNEIAINL